MDINLLKQYLTIYNNIFDYSDKHLKNHDYIKKIFFAFVGDDITLYKFKFNIDIHLAEYIFDYYIQSGGSLKNKKWLIIHKYDILFSYIKYIYNQKYINKKLDDVATFIQLPRNKTYYKTDLSRELNIIKSDDEMIDIDLLKQIKQNKQDIIYLNVTTKHIKYEKETFYIKKQIRPNYIDIILFTLMPTVQLLRGLLLSIKNLNEGGFVLLEHAGITTKYIGNIFYLFSQMFNTYETKDKIKKIINNYKFYYPYSINFIFLDFKYDREIEQKLEEILEFIETKHKDYLDGILETKEEVYDLLIQDIDLGVKGSEEFIKERFEYNNYAIQSYLYNLYNKKLFINNKTYEMENGEQLMLERINRATKLGFELKPQYQKYKDNFSYFLFNFFNMVSKYFSSIKLNNYPLEINISSDGSIKNFEKLFIKHQFYEKMYETRDLTLYKTVLKPYLRTFKKQLAKYLKKHYNISPPSYSPIPYVSQAWLKMYEMLFIFNLFDKDKDTIKTFHGCEIPGNFILATEYFIKNKTNVQNWEWVAQGYKPNIHLGTNPRYGTETYSLTDDYKILENNPDKWDFGEGNGDITDLNNIEYYKNKYSDMDLITFDCGSSWSDKQLVVKPNFAQMLFILRVLKERGTGLFKMKIPLLKEPIILSMLIFISTKFKKVYFYKPNQNTWSTEFYVICKNYNNKMTDDEYEKLSGLLDDFDSKKEVIDMKNLDIDIVNTLLYGINQIVEQHIYDMKRSFYYIDYFNENDDEDLLKDMMRKNRKRLKLWAEEFGIEDI